MDITELADEILDLRESIRMSEDTVSEILDIPYEYYLRIEEGDRTIPIDIYYLVLDLMEEEFGNINKTNS